MRSKFYVRAVKRGDYDPLCECDNHDRCDYCVTCTECERWNHYSEKWVRSMISHFWGTRGDVKKWPNSRALPPMLTRPMYRKDGTISGYLWVPSEPIRRMYVEGNRRRKNRRRR